jgi:hypothetical protein
MIVIVHIHIVFLGDHPDHRNGADALPQPKPDEGLLPSPEPEPGALFAHWLS